MPFHHQFDAVIWRFPGAGGWHFIALPPDIADDIRHFSANRAGAFGMRKVLIRIGTTEATTSLFYDSKRGTYLLPVKADIRKRESLSEGQSVAVSLSLT